MLLASLSFLFAAIAFWMAFRISRDIRRRRPWPTVVGTVLERGLGPAMGTAGRSYLPHVKYSYDVGGKQYVNDQVYLIRGTGGGASRMRQLADSIPDAVTVHYDPHDPARSYLLPNSMGVCWLLVGFGVFAVLLGFVHMATK